MFKGLAHVNKRQGCATVHARLLRAKLRTKSGTRSKATDTLDGHLHAARKIVWPNPWRSCSSSSGSLASRSCPCARRCTEKRRRCPSPNSCKREATSISVSVVRKEGEKSIVQLHQSDRGKAHGNEKQLQTPRKHTTQRPVGVRATELLMTKSTENAEIQ